MAYSGAHLAHLKLHEAIKTKRNILEESLKDNIKTQQGFEAMNPENGDPTKLFCNFKIHKDHKENKAPTPRSIVSGSGSILEILESKLNSTFKIFLISIIHIFKTQQTS